MVHLKISPFGSFGKCVNRLCCLPFLLEGGRFWIILNLCHQKSSVNSSHQSSTFRNRSPDAVCRTRPPETEPMLVPAESSAVTEMIAYLVTAGATIDTTSFDLQDFFVILTSNLVIGLLSLHTKTYVLCKSFPRFNTDGDPLRSWTVTNVSRSFTQTVVCSVVRVAPLAVTTVVGFFETVTISCFSGVTSTLLTLCIEACAYLIERLFQIQIFV